MTEPTNGDRFYPTQDPRFTIEGARGGLVKFDDGIRRGQLDWEMLGAGAFDMVVYGENCRWTAPEVRKMTREEVTGLFRYGCPIDGLFLAFRRGCVLGPLIHLRVNAYAHGLQRLQSLFRLCSPRTVRV